MYIANHYVRVDGQMYLKGEAIPDIPAENVEWLLSVGAIQLADGIEVAEDSEDTEVPEAIDVMAGVIMDAPTEGAPKKSSTGRKKKS